MKKPETNAFFSYNIAKQTAARQAVARKTRARGAFDRFVRQTVRNIFNAALFLLVCKWLGLVSVPWYGVVAYPLLWWVCLFLLVCAVAIYKGRRG